MRLIAAAVLAVSSLAFAGDGPTFAPAARPLTPNEVAAKFFSEDPVERRAAGEALTTATPQFLREVLSAALELRGPMPSLAGAGNGETSAEPPDLAPPG